MELAVPVLLHSVKTGNNTFTDWSLEIAYTIHYNPTHLFYIATCTSMEWFEVGLLAIVGYRWQFHHSYLVVVRSIPVDNISAPGVWLNSPYQRWDF